MYLYIMLYCCTSHAVYYISIVDVRVYVLHMHILYIYIGVLIPLLLLSTLKKYDTEMYFVFLGTTSPAPMYTQFTYVNIYIITITTVYYIVLERERIRIIIYNIHNFMSPSPVCSPIEIPTIILFGNGGAPI